MRIVIASSFVPFIRGGGRFIVDWLEEKLRAHGHQVEKFYLPSDERPEVLLDTLLAYRLMEATGGADRLITIRPPAHLLRHPNKIVWFIHHMRGYYDLAHTEHSSVPPNGEGRALREALVRVDTAGLAEARKIFTNSRVVGERLKNFNGLASEVLYPPLYDVSGFRFEGANEEIVTVCRVEPHKRQELSIRAMAHVKTGVRLRICGASANPGYEAKLKTLVRELNVENRVVLEFGWISEERKGELINACLASVYAPHDEDSYGYPTLEAASAKKATVTASDSGGTLEFIDNGKNGLIAEPTPEAFASAFDQLFVNRDATKRMGEAALETVAELKISWDHVISQMTAAH
jgi:glycosyltransferase involved in cell wall biosynthesis